jgi:hypothetical protein
VAVNLVSSLFAADHAVSQSELSESVTFMGYKSRAAFTVARALVGDFPNAERNEVDGILEELTAPVIVLVSECAYKPQIGQRVQLNDRSNQIVRVYAVIDDPAGVTYPIQVRQEHG